MKKIILNLALGVMAIPVFSQTARVQVIHNSADLAAATVDIYVENNGVALTKLEDVAFRTATAFLDLPASSPLKVAVAPSNSTTIADSLKEFNYNLTPDETYVLVAEGIVSGSGYSPATAFDIAVYGMGQESASTTGNTDVLVHHGATDAPTVDVRERTLGSTIVDDASYGDFAGYLELPTADYILDVQTSDATTTVASYSAPLATLNLDDAALVVVASGFLDPSQNSNGAAFGLWVALPAGGALVELPSVAGPTARVQIIHNSPDYYDVNNIDIYIENNGVLDTLIEFIDFRESTSFIDLPATSALKMTLTFPFASIGDTIPGKSRYNFNFDIDGKYVLVIDGIADTSLARFAVNPLIDIVVYDMGQESASTTGNTDVLVHHGATDAPTVDVRERTLGSTIVDDASYGDFAGYLELPTADYILDVQTSDATTTVASYSAPLATLNLDDQALVVLASGFLDPTVNPSLGANMGEAFGLWVALPTGGPLVELPSVSGPTARIQVIHNSADLAAATVDIYVENNGVALTKLEDVAFRTATAFLDLPATSALKVAVAPSNSTTIADSLKEFNYNLAIDETYVLVAEGIVSGSGYSPATAFDIAVYDMGQESASTTGNTDVLVHHGATDAPTVDVRERTLGSTIVDDASYGDFAGYLELPTADYILDVQTSDATTTVASYSAPLATLNLDDAALVVVASGFLDPSQNSNGAAFGLWVALPAGGALVELPSVGGPTARVQVIHNSADLAAATVDIYVENNGVALTKLEDVAFRTATAFLDLPATSALKVAVAPSNSTTIADSLKEFNYNLTMDESYLLIAEGIVSGSGYSPAQPFGIAVYQNVREVAGTTGNTDVLVYHGATDAPTVDIDEFSAGKLINDISYGEFATDYLELPTADYRLRVNDAAGTTTVAAYLASLATLNLDDAAITVLASGFLNPSQNSNGEAFGLWVALPTGGPLVELPEDLALSISEQTNNNKVSVYPNPVVNILNIEGINTQGMAINIYDISGRTVKSFILNNNTIDVSNLENGTYRMVLSNDSGVYQNTSFVKF